MFPHNAVGVWTYGRLLRKLRGVRDGKAEDVAELARAVCRVALLVESSQDFISISHILWVITRGVSHSSRTP